MPDNCRYESISKLLICVFFVFILQSCDSEYKDMQLGEERLSHDESEITAQMIEVIKSVSLQRNDPGDIKRFNQSKSLGCFNAAFSVAENLSDDLQQGVFISGQRYPAKVRFANATKFDDTEKDFRGMSIKLFNVPGASLWGKHGQQDFLLNSYPALFAANPEDFLDFIEATRDDKIWRYFINPAHFYSLKVIMSGREKIENPFSIRYWSTTPYRYGKNKSQAVKYSVKSCAASHPRLDVNKHEHFLTESMSEYLRQRPACFDFMVQFQRDPDAMPIENASVIWDEEMSSTLR